jgi:hypothetical protein
MKKVHLSLGEFPDPGLRRLGLEIREIDMPAPDSERISDLVQLFTQIEHTLKAEHGPIVQFVSVSGNCGSERVGLELAWAGASILGRDVLVLNGAGPIGHGYARQDLFEQAGMTLRSDDVSQLSLKDYMVKVSGFGMYIADLQDVYGGWRALAATEEIIGNLRDLSVHFDMIIVVAPPSQNDPLGAVLASKVDGNIMVVEAEHTRRAAAMRLRQTLTASGGVVLGAILNNQHVHTPQWLM